MLDRLQTRAAVLSFCPESVRLLSRAEPGSAQGLQKGTDALGLGHLGTSHVGAARVGAERLGGGRALQNHGDAGVTRLCLAG